MHHMDLLSIPAYISTLLDLYKTLIYKFHTLQLNALWKFSCTPLLLVLFHNCVSLVMVGLADIEVFKFYFQGCVWLDFPPLITYKPRT